jgi:hypothetical protein
VQTGRKRGWGHKVNCNVGTTNRTGGTAEQIISAYTSSASIGQRHVSLSCGSHTAQFLHFCFSVVPLFFFISFSLLFTFYAFRYVPFYFPSSLSFFQSFVLFMFIYLISISRYLPLFLSQCDSCPIQCL